MGKNHRVIDFLAIINHHVLNVMAIPPVLMSKRYLSGISLIRLGRKSSLLILAFISGPVYGRAESLRGFAIPWWGG